MGDRRVKHLDKNIKTFKEKETRLLDFWKPAFYGRRQWRNVFEKHNNRKYKPMSFIFRQTTIHTYKHTLHISKKTSNY